MFWGWVKPVLLCFIGFFIVWPSRLDVCGISVNVKFLGNGINSHDTQVQMVMCQIPLSVEWVIQPGAMHQTPQKPLCSSVQRERHHLENLRFPLQGGREWRRKGDYCSWDHWLAMLSVCHSYDFSDKSTCAAMSWGKFPQVKTIFTSPNILVCQRQEKCIRMKWGLLSTFSCEKSGLKEGSYKLDHLQGCSSLCWEATGSWSNLKSWRRERYVALFPKSHHLWTQPQPIQHHASQNGTGWKDSFESLWPRVACASVQPQ